MKVEMVLIYKKAIFYYSTSGNTKALVELTDTTGFDVFNMARMPIESINFEPYDIILIGTSTTGRGVPHSFFLDIKDKLFNIKNKRIGLFGSGNTIYSEYCGALDILEDLLRLKNKILFKFKFESYPTSKVFSDFQDIINKINKGEMI